jgi:hypothetical protein
LRTRGSGNRRRSAERTPQPVECPRHEPVVRPRPTPFGLDKACVPQDAEMMRNRRLRELEHRRQIAHAALAGGQAIDDRDAGGIGERLEGKREVRRRARRHRRNIGRAAQLWQHLELFH